MIGRRTKQYLRRGRVRSTRASCRYIISIPSLPRTKLTARTVAFVVEEKPHPRFEREGDDLIVKLNVTLSQALLGLEGGGRISKEVDQLDGRRIPVDAPSGVIQPGAETRVTGEGMPVSKAGSVKKQGDLIIRWNVVFPKSLTGAQKDALRGVL